MDVLFSLQILLLVSASYFVYLHFQEGEYFER
jgi:hypothetical protein